MQLPVRPGSELRERNIIEGAILSVVRLTHLLLTFLLLVSRAHPAAVLESREQLSPLQAGTVPAKIKRQDPSQRCRARHPPAQTVPLPVLPLQLARLLFIRVPTAS